MRGVWSQARVYDRTVGVRRTVRLVIPLALFCFHAVACSKPPTVNVENIEAGKQLYAVHCALCHGNSGEGDGPAGGDMSPKASRLRALSDDLVVEAIRNGVKRDGRQTMPPAKAISDEQIRQILTFVRTLK